MQVAQNFPHSEQARQLAETYQLGTLQQEYGVKMTRATLISGIGSLALALLFDYLGYTTIANPGSDMGNAALMLVLGGLALLGALYCFAYPFLYRSWHVYVFSEGFAFTRGGKLDAQRWEQIDSILFAITRRYRNGIYMGTQHKYTINVLDGRKIILNDRISNVERLGNNLSDMVTRVKLPQIFASYNAGNTVTFGPLGVNLQGVSNSRELVPWGQIKDVRVTNGVVTVKKEGQWLNWSSVRVANIPNFFIFLALVDAIRRQKV